MNIGDTDQRLDFDCVGRAGVDEDLLEILGTSSGGQSGGSRGNQSAAPSASRRVQRLKYSQQYGNRRGHTNVVTKIPISQLPSSTTGFFLAEFETPQQVRRAQQLSAPRTYLPSPAEQRSFLENLPALAGGSAEKARIRTRVPTTLAKQLETFDTRIQHQLSKHEVKELNLNVIKYSMEANCVLCQCKCSRNRNLFKGEDIIVALQQSSQTAILPDIIKNQSTITVSRPWFLLESEDPPILMCLGDVRLAIIPSAA